MPAKSRRVSRPLHCSAGIKCVTVTHCMLRVLYVGHYAVTRLRSYAFYTQPAMGSSVKIKRLSLDNAQSPIRRIIKCHILTVVGMFK